MIKNQSIALLTSGDGRGSRVIDFSGVNRIAFQPRQVFYEHSRNSMRSNEGKSKIEEADQFIRLAHSYNTSVDLLISGDPAQHYLPHLQEPPTVGAVVIMASDIVKLLAANDFDGVTLDLDNLFSGRMSLYRRLTHEILKGLEADKQGETLSVNVIISDTDLPVLPEDAERYNTEAQENTRLLLRLLDEGMKNRLFNVENRLLVRTSLTRPPRSASAIPKSCGVVAGPDFRADRTFQYSQSPSLNPSTFPTNKVYPLILLNAIDHYFDAEIKTSDAFKENDCGDQFLYEYIVGKYQGLAFEDSRALRPEPSGKLSPINTFTALDEPILAVSLAETVKDQALAAWPATSPLTLIVDRDLMNWLKLAQETLTPNFCQKICPLQGILLTVVCLTAAALVAFLLISRFSYNANRYVRRYVIFVYVALIFLMMVIQAIALCQTEYDFIRNYTFVILLATMIIGGVSVLIFRIRKGSFP